MNAKYIHDGKAIDFLSETAVPAGTVVVVEELVGITKLDLETNRLGALYVVGVFDVVKGDGEIGLGKKIGTKPNRKSSPRQERTSCSASPF